LTNAVAAAAWDRASRLIGLGLRARTVVVGVEQARQAAIRGTMVLAIVADDASPHSRAKVLPMLKAKRIEVVSGVTAAMLGAAVGREATTAVAVLDAALARGIQDAIRPDSA
jgi:ribosomal protein L7Ae-like RNA K-turn-binding protein